MILTIIGFIIWLVIGYYVMGWCTKILAESPPIVVGIVFCVIWPLPLFVALLILACKCLGDMNLKNPWDKFVK